MNISVIVPIYNEGEVVLELYRRLQAVLAEHTYEIIFIDDGSAPAPRALAQLATEDRQVKVLTLSRNFGHQSAVSAGLDHAQGDVVIVMDGDLQDPPEVIPAFLEKFKEGYDVVYGVRKKRKEVFWKRAAYFLFYRLLRAGSHTSIPLDSGDFGLLSRRAANALSTRAMPEHNRYIRGLRAWVGFNQAGVPYERAARAAGSSKFTLEKLFTLAYDGAFSFSHTPIKLMISGGFMLSLVAFVGIIVVLYRRLVETPVEGFTSTAILILFFSGTQLLCLGILGEYIRRISDEVKNRPHYVIKESVNLNETHDHA
jgi:dolichol-phosphate mannosyltransferase